MLVPAVWAGARAHLPAQSNTKRSIAVARYTPEFLAAAQHGYEHTDQPMRELARDLGIGVTTLSTLAETHGWAKRSQRKRGLPPAMQLLEEARGLASASPPPERVSEQETPSPTLPLSGGGSGDAAAEGNAPVASEPPTLLDRMEQILVQLIAAQEAAPANGIHSPQGARNLEALIQAMRALKGLRGGAAIDTGPIDDDDMPADIDEFRRDLARRIDAFVASRADAGDDRADAGPAPVDEVR